MPNLLEVNRFSTHASDDITRDTRIRDQIKCFHSLNASQDCSEDDAVVILLFSSEILQPENSQTQNGLLSKQFTFR